MKTSTNQRITVCLALTVAACTWARLVCAQPSAEPATPETTGEEATSEAAGVPETTAEETVPEGPAPVSTPQEDLLGGPGESCRARADCQRGLKCIEAMCIDEREGTTCQTSAQCGPLKCIENICTSGIKTNRSEDDEADEPGWMNFKFGKGVHGLVGWSIVGGPSGFIDTELGGFDYIAPSWAWELNLSLLMRRFEFGLHFSPVTFKMSEYEDDTQLSMLFTVGGYIPLTKRVSWPMRFGAGFVAVNVPVQPQFEFDLIGAAIHVGHLTFEIEAPSFRSVLLLDYSEIMLGWHFGLKTSYVF